MDLFDKCSQDKRAEGFKAMGIFPYFQEIEENWGPEVKIKGKTVIMAGSNNYLGLTRHPEVMAASKRAIDEFGTSCSGSRFLNGNLVLHTALEAEQIRFIGKYRLDSSLVFSLLWGL